MNRRAFFSGAFVIVASQALPRWVWPWLKPKQPVYELRSDPRGMKLVESELCPPGMIYFLKSQNLWAANPAMFATITNLGRWKLPHPVRAIRLQHGDRA